MSSSMPPIPACSAAAVSTARSTAPAAPRSSPSARNCVARSTRAGCRPVRPWRRRRASLPAQWVVHTVGPVYSPLKDQSALLASCYTESLRVAGRARGVDHRVPRDLDWRLRVPARAGRRDRGGGGPRRARVIRRAGAFRPLLGSRFDNVSRRVPPNCRERRVARGRTGFLSGSRAVRLCRWMTGMNSAFPPDGTQTRWACPSCGGGTPWRGPSTPPRLARPSSSSPRRGSRTPTRSSRRAASSASASGRRRPSPTSWSRPTQTAAS